MFLVEEEFVGNEGTMFVMPVLIFKVITCEAVIIIILLAVNSLALVLTFKESAVKEWYFGKQFHNFIFRYGEFLLISINVFDVLSFL